MEHQIIIGFYRPQIAKHRVTFKELSDQDATRGVLPEYFRHALVDVVSGMTTEFFHVACFAAVIEFFLGPTNKLAYRFNHPVNESQAQTLDEIERCHH